MIPQRILIYHQACIGDMLMAIPAFQAIRAAFPRAELDLFAISGVPGSIQKTLIEPLGIFHQMLFIETYGNRFQRILPRLRIIREMLTCKYEKVFMVTFQPRWYEYCFFQMAGVRDLVSLADWSLVKGNRRANDVLLDSLEVQGIPCGNFRGLPDLHCSKTEQEHGIQLFQELKIPEEKIPFLVCIGGRNSASRFPAGRHLSLLKKILGMGLCYPVFLCDERERKQTETMIRTLETGKILTAGKAYSLREMICALHHFRFYLGNDTGAIHLAAAAGVPCIGLYGCRDAGRFFHPMGDNHIIIQENVDCVGCGLQACPKGTPPPCICRIKDETVLAAVRTLLNKTS